MDNHYLTREQVKESLAELKDKDLILYCTLKSQISARQEEKKRAYSARIRLKNVGQRPMNYNHSRKG